MYENFSGGDLVYNYLWNAPADHDNPKIIHGKDHTSLNRTEGYEMLYFIKAIAKSWDWKTLPQKDGRWIENMVHHAPANIETHAGIKAWLESNHTKFAR